MNEPKVLVFDIETSPIVAHVWGIRDQHISLSQVVKDIEIMAWAAKWLGSPAKSIRYMDTRKSTEKAVLEGIWGLLNEADIVITQNGQYFDSRILNSRFIIHGMKPPKPYKHLDTYKIAKGVAQFTSHKLEYLTEKLCTKYKKLSHKRFPGMVLWNECLKGNKKAWDEMREYNEHDVLSTEELYLKLQGWTPKTAPAVSTTGCVSCGSRSVEKRGMDRTTATKWQRLHCNSCGKWFRGDKIAN